MEPARSIAKLGFRKWYERRLIEAHAWLFTALLCAIYVGVSLEGISFRRFDAAWLGTVGGVFFGGLIVWHSLRRYFAILAEAERFSGQSTCTRCKAYAAFEVINERAEFTVRCRKCHSEWSMG
ncbi:MAG: hypothetical protein ACJ8G5_16985 [Burkholderiales bacterium]